MTLSDELQLIRVYLAEPDNTGRWSDSDLIALLNPARQELTMDLLWPEATYTFFTSSGVGEYTLPEFMQVLRVYVNKARIVATRIADLEGEQIGFYDQSGTNQVPMWKDTTQNTSTYPVPNTESGIQYPSLPFVAGKRPQYYLRGGQIGLIEVPLGSYQVDVDMIPAPPILANALDPDIFPDNFKRAIAWKTVEQALYADAIQTGASLDGANSAHDRYEEQLGKLRFWKEGAQGDISNSPIIATYRSWWNGISRGVGSSGKID